MFISRDPIGLLVGNNVFQYAPNPVSWIDPLGLEEQCPSSPPKPTGKWKPYVGQSCVFHCCYTTVLENRIPTPDNPIAECVYDNQNRLVTNTHKYAGCKGTADQYPADQLWNHSVNDDGGIVSHGRNGLTTSIEYQWDAEVVEPISNLLNDNIVQPTNQFINQINKEIKSLYGIE